MNTNQELDGLIKNLVIAVGSLGPYHSLSITQKIDMAYKLSQRLQFISIFGTTSTSTTTTTT